MSDILSLMRPFLINEGLAFGGGRDFGIRMSHNHVIYWDDIVVGDMIIDNGTLASSVYPNVWVIC